MIGRITLFESPDTLAKRWTLGKDGKLTKTSAAQMTRGTYSVREFTTLEELSDLLGRVTTKQAVCCSLPLDGSTEGVITTKRAAKAGMKTRSKSDFGLPASLGLLFLDNDASSEDAALSRDGLWKCLVEAVPALATAGVIWRPSGSSHVFCGDEDRTGLRGQHLFVLLADASDGPRIIKIIAARLWLAGLGTIQVSKAGSLLVRCPVDTAPTDAARLIFAGGAECGEGLEQHRGPPVILNRGGFLDGRDVLDLTPSEQARYEALVEQARAAAGPEAAQRRAEHRGAAIANRLPEMMKRGVSATEAEQRVGAAIDAAYGGVLLADFEFTVVRDDGTWEAVTVGQVLTDRDRWHECDVLDPINPEHRGGAPDCRLYLHGTSPIAYSLDDGGVVYRLRSAQQRFVVAKGNRGELVSQLAATVAADARVFRTAGGPVLVERGRMLTMTVDRLMNLIGSLVVLAVKSAKGESPVDLPRETAVLVLAALSA